MDSDWNSSPAGPPQHAHDAQSEYFGPVNFTWLVRGRLGGMPCPGIVRTVEADLEALRRLGVTTLVTLRENWKPPKNLIESHGIESVYVQIPDMEPPTMEQALELCAQVASIVENGGSVVFHCRAGRGRTGTLLAAMLIWYEPDSEIAVARVKATNPYWIESDSQMEFLKEFAVERRKAFALPAENRPEGITPETAEGWRDQLEQLLDRHGWSTPSDALQRPFLISEGNQMSLDKALQATMGSVPECLASGYVDMETGMLLGVHTVDSHPQEILDVLAAATADLFQGSSIVAIENMFKKARGTEKDENHYFHEMIIFSENLLHVFMRVKKYPGHVACFVCRKSANPGMVLTKARMGMESVAAAV